MLFRGRLKNNNQMEQPRMYKEEEYRELMAFIQPKYPVTKGITSKNISKAVKQVLSLCPMPEEFLPEEILKKEELMPYGEALAQIHFPENRESLDHARKRLVFDEFFLFILMMQQSKMLTEKEKTPVPWWKRRSVCGSWSGFPINSPAPRTRSSGKSLRT